MYSAQLLDHFQNPRNAGVVEDPSATAELENPACGDVLKLTAKIADNRLLEVRFQAKGCVPSIACGSAMTTLVQGKTIEEAFALNRGDLIRVVSGLPQASEHAAQLAIDTLRRLVGPFKGGRNQS